MWEDATTLVLFDDLCRKYKLIQQNDCTQEFLMFVKHQEQCRLKWKESKEECVRLKSELDKANAKITKLEKMLNSARVSLDKERKNTMDAKYERDELREQVGQIEDILSCVRRAGDKLANETKEKLDKFLTMTHVRARQSEDYNGMRLDTIDEINSTEHIRLRGSRFSSSESSSSWSIHTGSLLSDKDYTRSEDTLDLDNSLSKGGIFKKPRRSASPSRCDEVPAKKRKSARLQNRVEKIQKKTTDHVVATTTVTVPKEGPVIACSTIETFPKGPKGKVVPSAPPAPPKTSSDTESDGSEAIKNFPFTSSPNLYSNRLFTRPHCFRNKTVLKPSEECGVCGKKVSFGNKIFHCPDCRVICHGECRDKVPLPCIAVVETPRGNSCMTVADYCSKSSPMIPPIVIHCVIEVESRGLNEVGIYRIPGSEKDVRSLKDRFLRGKGVCSLSNHDIHVVCGTMKDFLRNLSEPLITYSLWQDFIRASEERDPSERESKLYQAICQLPQPNRDTLAFLVQHLQKVSQSPACKMPKSNLAKVFGPSIVGFSSAEPAKSEMYLETAQQAKVVECLLDMPTQYWESFVNDEFKENAQAQVQTVATPIGSMALRKRNRDKARKIFSTPPVK